MKVFILCVSSFEYCKFLRYEWEQLYHKNGHPPPVDPFRIYKIGPHHFSRSFQEREGGGWPRVILVSSVRTLILHMYVFAVYLLPTFILFHPLLSLLSTFLHSNPLSSILIHFHQFYPLSSTRGSALVCFRSP